MNKFSSGKHIATKLVCVECVGEQYLKVQITKNCESRECTYCGARNEPAITMLELADCVEKAIQSHFSRTPTEPDEFEQWAMRNAEYVYEYERPGEPLKDVICDLVSCDADIAADVVTLLSNRHDNFHPGDPDEGECEFARSSYYELTHPTLDNWTDKWGRVEESLKHESRFFNQIAWDVFSSVFADIENARTYVGDTAVVSIGPGTDVEALYRGREFQSLDALKDALKNPVAHLGPPPGRIARASRMNASGISIFYGAQEPHSALAEVRPVVGSNVVIAKFTIVRDLKLLDLRRLDEVHSEGSFFDPQYAQECERAGFLRTLCRRLIIPVMPNDQEQGYLTTQAVADYLAGMKSPALDGILFPAVQDGNGVNIALFHKASLVEPLAFEAETKATVQTHEYDVDTDENYFSYRVDFYVGQDNKLDVSHRTDGAWLEEWSAPVASRLPALRLDLDSIEVHEIQTVQVKSRKHHVRVNTASSTLKQIEEGGDF